MTPDHIIHLWSTGLTADQIADQTGYSRDTVFWHLRRARDCGDPRAARRECQMPARRRRTKIMILSELGLPPETIASFLGCTYRTVRLRLSEMER